RESSPSSPSSPPPPPSLTSLCLSPRDAEAPVASAGLDEIVVSTEGINLLRNACVHRVDPSLWVSQRVGEDAYNEGEIASAPTMDAVSLSITLNYLAAG
ncbi:hypothetical protein KIPB_017385, partial [Kipferlia bialata]